MFRRQLNNSTALFLESMLNLAQITIVLIGSKHLAFSDISFLNKKRIT